MSNRRASSSFRIVSPRPIREIAREAVANIDTSMATMTNWGVRIPLDSRLHKARTILADAVESGVLVPSHRGDLLGLRAVELAFDYLSIAETLPSRPLAAVRRELRESLKGEIDPPEAARGPLQLQSQAVLRAMFVRAGVLPLHPTHSPKLGVSGPDMVLENGSLRYAVEGKRPQRTSNVLPRFKDASSQLVGFGLPGAVFVDVSDCVRGLSADALGTEVIRVAEELSQEVFVRGHGHKPPYEHVMVTAYMHGSPGARRTVPRTRWRRYTSHP